MWRCSKRHIVTRNKKKKKRDWDFISIMRNIVMFESCVPL